MSPRDIESSHDKGLHAEVEDTKDGGDELVGTHYTPASEAEKALDRRINWKLDFTVLLTLAISFIVKLPDSTRSARPRPDADMKPPALRHRQDQRRVRRNQQLHQGR
jgi:hypothetical protein